MARLGVRSDLTRPQAHDLLLNSRFIAIDAILKTDIPSFFVELPSEYLRFPDEVVAD